MLPRRTFHIDGRLLTLLSVMLVFGSLLQISSLVEPSDGPSAIFDRTVYGSKYNETEINEAIQDAADWILSVQKGNNSWARLENQDGNLLGTHYAIIGLLNAGYNITDAKIKDGLDYIKSLQNPNGSFESGYRRGLLLDTVYGLMQLHMDGSNVTHARNWLLAQQDANGSFGEDKFSRNAVMSLIVTGLGPTNDSVKRGIDYVLDTQGTSVDLVAKDALTLMVAGYSPDHDLIAEKIKFLVDSQNPDGSWEGGDPGQTSEIMITLAVAGLSIGNETIDDGIDNLMDQQEANGAWEAGNGMDAVKSTEKCMVVLQMVNNGTIGMYGSAIPSGWLEVDLNSDEFAQKDRVVIDTIARGEGLVSVEIRDPDNETFFLDTEETDDNFTCQFSFRLPKNATLGRYEVWVTTSNSSHWGRADFNVTEYVNEYTPFKLTLNVTAEPTGVRGGQYWVNFTLLCTENLSVKPVIQFWDSEDYITSPVLRPRLNLTEDVEGSVSIPVLLSTDHKAGKWGWKLQIMTDLPSNGGIALKIYEKDIIVT